MRIKKEMNGNVRITKKAIIVSGVPDLAKERSLVITRAIGNGHLFLYSTAEYYRISEMLDLLSMETRNNHEVRVIKRADDAKVKKCKFGSVKLLTSKEYIASLRNVRCSIVHDRDSCWGNHWLIY